jgi:2-hydroxycyclohexanecarboxyl-CoA dehydrogenase
VSRVRGALVAVTGAGSGIGEATSVAFAQAGARVLSIDINHDSAERVAAACAAAGPEAQSYTCDVADPDAVFKLREQIEAHHGVPDALVNNAGVGILGPLLDSTVEDWAWLRSINLDGVAHGCYAFGPGMIARGSGQVVNVASMAGFIPNRYMAAYCASKAAVVSLSQCLRADWAPHGVGVSVVCPAVISTPIATNSRYVGAVADKRSKAERTLGWGQPPSVVAQVIVECVERNRDVVPVGRGSTLAYKLLRGAPQPVLSLVAKTKLL